MVHFLARCKIFCDKALRNNYALDAYQHAEMLSRYNSREREKTAESATIESRRQINLECLRRGLLSVVVRQATRRQYECKDLLSPFPPFLQLLRCTSPQFSFHSLDLKEVPLTRRRFPRSRVRREKARGVRAITRM